MLQSSMTGEMAAAVDPRWENEKLLMKAVMEKLNISEEDMNQPGFIKEKLREINIDILLS